MAVEYYRLGQDGGGGGAREAPSHKSAWEGVVLGSPGLLGVFVMGSKGCLQGRQLPLGAHVARQGAVRTCVYVPCSASWSCETERCWVEALRATEQGTSPLHDTPVPSTVTLHTAQTGGFFRKTFSRKLCGSAFLG